MRKEERKKERMGFDQLLPDITRATLINDPSLTRCCINQNCVDPRTFLHSLKIKHSCLAVEDETLPSLRTYINMQGKKENLL
jgi:hypothetical protein